MRSLLSLQRPLAAGEVVQELPELEQVTRVHARKTPISADEASIGNRPSGLERVEFMLRRSSLTKTMNTTWRVVECLSGDETDDLLVDAPTDRKVWNVKAVFDREERGRWLWITAESGDYGR